MSESDSTARSHETRVTIDAPLEDVWKSLTEPAALARWFAPKMTVEPGIGGFVLADWGPGIEWKTMIEIWEPPRHLRLAETRDRMLGPVSEQMEPCRLVEDFFLESVNGKTELRLVHSGFGSSRAWDMEFEGTRGGWATCFLRLKEGMELHRNESAYNAIIPVVLPGVDRVRVLAAIESAIPQPSEIIFRNDSHLAWRLPDRIFTTSVSPTTEGSVAYVEMLLFGQTATAAATVEDEWKTRLAQLVPAPAIA